MVDEFGNWFSFFGIFFEAFEYEVFGFAADGYAFGEVNVLIYYFA